MRQQIKESLPPAEYIPPLEAPISLSFYFPNILNSARKNITPPSESKEDKSVDSTDVIGLVAQFFSRLKSWRKLQLFERLFIVVICILCVMRHDLFSIIELFIVLTVGMSYSLMIPYWVYKSLLGVAAISITSKYLVQLPFFNQCVNSDGIMEFFFLVGSDWLLLTHRNRASIRPR